MYGLAALFPEVIGEDGNKRGFLGVWVRGSLEFVWKRFVVVSRP